MKVLPSWHSLLFLPTHNDKFFCLTPVNLMGSISDIYRSGPSQEQVVIA
jgi:hypothetical protein